ncbi:cyclin-dependent kinase 2-associated protein 1-like isoform X2 [Centruroides vittatus]|nr:cyclin-dependent kinase 2-associated protein 1-like [Centruroides sculpturatus]XP_023224717.1 cyclin-dependent kinase 2-associated protein 1-like [Centruroides sculpturatus]
MDDDCHSPNQATLAFSNPGTPRNDRLNDDISGMVSSSTFAAVGQTTQAAAAAYGTIRQQPQSKYAQLLGVIEELGKDIRPTYAGSKSSAERLKRGIVHARILVRECLMETERNART